MTRRIVTAREQVEMLAPWRQAWQIKEMVPADASWLEPGGLQADEVPHYPDRSPLGEQNEEYTGKWFHVSPHALAPGDRIVPGGGRGLHDTSTEWEGDPRRNHVWMSPNVDKAKWWMGWYGPSSHLYEVHPGDRPQPWNSGGEEGWVAPHATVKREIQLTRREKRNDIGKNPRSQKDYGGADGGWAGAGWPQQPTKTRGRQSRTTAWRTAMPAPTPPGITYHYHPTQETIPSRKEFAPGTADWSPTRTHPFNAPGVTAHDNGQPVGYLSWYGGGDGEIGMIQVHPDYRRHGIGTGMMDLATQVDPTVHHAEDRTPLGDSWAAYEQSRRTAGRNGDLPEGLRFEEHNGGTRAFDGDQLIGYLDPDKRTNTIQMVKVHPDYLRRGVSTAMLDWHHQNVDPDLAHSSWLTPEGRSWGRSMGNSPRKWNRQPSMPNRADDPVWQPRTAVWREHPWLDDGNTAVFNDPLDPTADIATYLRGPEDAYDEYNNGYGSWEQRVRDHPPDPTPTGVDWFHATAADLPVGTVLAPHKGKVPWLDNPYHGGLDNRANWTWVEYDLTHSDEWLGYMVRDHGEGHLYRVKPHIGPFPWNGDAREGWVTDYAVIVERVQDAGGQQLTAASDVDEIMNLLGPSPGRPRPSAPSPPPDPDRYYNHLKGQEDRTHTAHAWLPTDVVDHYREYDRPTDSPDYQAVKRAVSEDGIKLPLWISANDTHGMLVEGNNRLKAAKELGISHLPVRFTYNNPVMSNEGVPVPHHPSVAPLIPQVKAKLAARRFNRDYQLIGHDYFPTNVISQYMQRKETGFGDEKSPLYEMQGKPPLSQQIGQGGYEKPVELFTDGKSGYVGDGHHRIDIARQLGHSHVPVQVYWRNPYDDGSPVSSNKIDPWTKSWLTDMRRGRQTAMRLAIQQAHPEDDWDD